MPKTIDVEERDTSAADAAVAEVTAEQDAVVTIDFEGTKYTFKRKKLDAPQFRLFMQKDRDVAAIEWLLGPVQFNAFLRATADEDGCTPTESYARLIEDISKSVGAGNS